jgi:hypothetical protein
VEAAIFNVLASAQFEVGNRQLAIFPNPVDETLHVTCDQLFGAAAEISVYNLIGENILTAHLPALSPFDTNRSLRACSVNVSHLLPGMYWIQISGIEKTFRSTFVKQ